MKQKKLIIHHPTSLLFLLFYSPKPRSQVRILIYRKWSIETSTIAADQHSIHHEVETARWVHGIYFPAYRPLITRCKHEELTHIAAT